MGKVKILVTGGEGFIGSHLVDALVEEGHEVFSIDKYLGYRNSGAEYASRDLTIGPYAISIKNVDCIFHLAALPRIQYSIKYPRDVLLNNYLATVSVLEYARLNEVKVIYAASSSYYGSLFGSPYALSKWQGEQLCNVYSSVYNVPVVKARFFNVYGPQIFIYRKNFITLFN